MASKAVGIYGLSGTTGFLDKPFLSGSVKPAFQTHHKTQGKQLSNAHSLRIVASAKWDDNLNKKSHYLPMLLSIFTFVGDANAVTKEDILTALTKVEDTYQKLEGVTSSAYGVSKEFIEQTIKNMKPAMDAAMPYIQKASDSAVQIASPVASDVTQQAQKALESAGVDSKSVVEAAKTAAVVAGGAAEQTTKAIEEVKPIASATIDSLLSSDPIVLVGGAGALILLYLLVPSIFSTIAFSLRGYKGELSPAQALQLLTKQDYVMIDIRTEKEKSKAGIPSLPRSAKNKLFSLAVEEFPNKLRSLLRNSKKVEAEVAALKISYLKRLNKNSRVVIMDSYGDVAKTVARALTGLGFNNAWVLTDGFSGGRGWLQSCLGTESYNASFAEILSPSRIIPAARGRFGTTSTGSQATSRRLLASGLDD